MGYRQCFEHSSRSHAHPSSLSCSLHFAQLFRCPLPSGTSRHFFLAYRRRDGVSRSAARRTVIAGVIQDARRDMPCFDSDRRVLFSQFFADNFSWRATHYSDECAYRRSLKSRRGIGYRRIPRVDRSYWSEIATLIDACRLLPWPLQLRRFSRGRQYDTVRSWTRSSCRAYADRGTPPHRPAPFAPRAAPPRSAGRRGACRSMPAA